MLHKTIYNTAISKLLGKYNNPKYTSNYLNKIMFNDDSLSLRLHYILEKKTALLVMAKDLKLQKQLKRLFIYMLFQDEKPCQGQHSSSITHPSLFFLLKSTEG